MQKIQEQYDYYLTKEGQKELKKESMSFTLKLIEIILNGALSNNVSDIHLEPQQAYVNVRFRRDGVLHEVLRIDDFEAQEALMSSIKAQASMFSDGSSKRKPQDGRWSHFLGGEQVDFRISTVPVINGEKMVLRIFRGNRSDLSINDIGAPEELVNAIRDFTAHKTGIVFVTGPTGSGKTTTLYAVLNTINRPEINIVTLEDPVEYKLERINQSQIDVKSGFDFASGLRALLRQDPDVVFVGEIRDKETAEICLRSSLTGHLVLTTVHTNDAATAITRLLDMNIPPFMIAAAPSLIINQRLLRKLCDDCKQTAPLPDKLPRELEKLHDEGVSVAVPKGCSTCAGTGYNGRIGVFEYIVTSNKIRDLVINKASTEDIRKTAIEGGMKTLMQDAVRILRTGETSIEEVFKILQ